MIEMNLSSVNNNQQGENKMELWDELGTLITATSELAMHPRLQENWRIAQSELESLANANKSVANLGLENNQPIISAFFAARLKKQDELEEMGYVPKISYLGDPVELWEIPASFIMTLGSATSAKAATVVVRYTDVNESGYGDINSAEITVDDIHDTLEHAELRVSNVARALRTMKSVMKEHERTRGENRTKASYGPSF